MISLSAAILVATCTATFGLHSSSSTTSSYSYFAFAWALRNLTARSAELRPPSPLAETPPVNGPMKPTLTLSFACAVATGAPTKSALAKIILNCLVILDIVPPSVLAIYFRSSVRSGSASPDVSEDASRTSQFPAGNDAVDYHKNPRLSPQASLNTRVTFESIFHLAGVTRYVKITPP